jgi:hypothetical protein
VHPQLAAQDLADFVLLVLGRHQRLAAAAVLVLQWNEEQLSVAQELVAVPARGEGEEGRGAISENYCMEKNIIFQKLKPTSGVQVLPRGGSGVCVCASPAPTA